MARQSVAACIEGPSARGEGAVVVSDGAHATRVGDTIELRDAEARLLIRYRDGQLELSPLRGDLVLAAPQGRVRVQAALDLELAAGRDVQVAGARRVELAAGSSERDEHASSLKIDHGGATLTGKTVELRAKRLASFAAAVEVVAGALRTGAATIETRASKVETFAERVKLEARDVLSEVLELVEVRAGKMRSIVRGHYAVESQSTSLASKDDTSVDGRRVLLG